MDTIPQTYLEKKRYFKQRLPEVKAAICGLFAEALKPCDECGKKMQVQGMNKCIVVEHGKDCIIVNLKCPCEAGDQHFLKGTIKTILLEER